jgi:hypothetical protein
VHFRSITRGGFGLGGIHSERKVYVSVEIMNAIGEFEIDEYSRFRYAHAVNTSLEQQLWSPDPNTEQPTEQICDSQTCTFPFSSAVHVTSSVGVLQQGLSDGSQLTPSVASHNGSRM